MIWGITPQELFPKVPIFAGLSDEAMELLLLHVRTMDYSADNIVISEGTLGDSLYIIAEGAVEVVKNLECEQETVLAKLEARNFFGEMCIIESVARSASVRAVNEPTVLFVLHASDMYRLFRKLPDQYAVLILNIARDMSRRLREVDGLYAAKTI